MHRLVDWPRTRWQDWPRSGSPVPFRPTRVDWTPQVSWVCMIFTFFNLSSFNFATSLPSFIFNALVGESHWFAVLGDWIAFWKTVISNQCDLQLNRLVNCCSVIVFTCNNWSLVLAFVITLLCFSKYLLYFYLNSLDCFCCTAQSRFLLNISFRFFFNLWLFLILGYFSNSLELLIIFFF